MRNFLDFQHKHKISENLPAFTQIRVFVLFLYVATNCFKIKYRQGCTNTFYNVGLGSLKQLFFSGKFKNMDMAI